MSLLPTPLARFDFRERICPAWLTSLFESQLTTTYGPC